MRSTRGSRVSFRNDLHASRMHHDRIPFVATTTTRYSAAVG